jgi:hypothetical protein
MSIEEFRKSQMFTHKSPNLVKLGFDFTNNLEEEYTKIQDLLSTLYLIKCESMLTIMKQFGIPSSRTMDILFRLFDIEARSFSEATSNAYMTERQYPRETKSQYKSGWHKSWNGKSVYLRSSYEKEVAEILDAERVDYHVESLRIKYYDSSQKKFRIAIPDFYLPDSNTIIEVKSDYTLDPLEMECKKQSYKELGYKFKLYLEHKIVENW